MQGRLTPMQDRGIQFFPFDNWKNEFYTAKKIGLSEIEWIFDFTDLEKNPLWSRAGQDQIKSLIDQTGILVNSICFDYFMRRPFYKYSKNGIQNMYKENIEIIEVVIKAAAKIGAKLIEIPMVDNSSMKALDEKKEAICFIRKIADIANNYNITIGLETDLPPDIFRNFLGEIETENVAANYDSGNSSGLGYNPREEICLLSNYIFNVHIKDRVYKGTTVALGTGSADFEAVFSALKQINYQGSIILQAARAEENREIENIIQQKAFVENYLNKY